MGNKLILEKGSYKIVTILVLLVIAVFLTYYFHFVLGSGTIFTHFFYFPIILAAIWWKRKGLAIPLFLSFLLILSYFLAPKLPYPLYEDLIRVIVFMAIGIVVAVLSEKIEQKESKLIESEGKFRSVADSAVDGIITTDTDGKIVIFNSSLKNIFGYEIEEIKGKHVTMLMPDRFKQNFLDQLEKFKSTGNHERAGKTFETIGLKKDGSEFPFEISIATWSSKGKLFTTSIIRDVTDRKKLEKTLKESEKRYSITLDAVNDGLWDWNVTSGDAFFSPNYYKLLGYEPGEFPANYATWRSIVNPDEIDFVEKRLQESIKSGRGFEIDLSMKTKSNEWLWVSTRGKAIEKDPTGTATRLVGTLSDITKRMNAEKTIRESLKEKEMLLKEIHHRVKNNLMIISSLLNLQSGYIKDKASKDIFKESQNRARSMALIHERLYQSTDLKRIDFGEYITSLSNELFHTYVADPSIIELKIDVDDIFLDINTAIPLGLIVNELITNSLKYAFPDGMMGKISVDFHPLDDHYEFTVKDNGIGFPEDIDYQNTESLGLQMVTSLTDQIDGNIQFEVNNGTEFKITFKEEI